MIEVVKMEQEDKKKEVLQYLRDHQDIIRESIEYNGHPDDLDKIVSDITLLLIQDDIKRFRRSRGTRSLNEYVKELISIMAFGEDANLYTEIEFSYNEPGDMMILDTMTYTEYGEPIIKALPIEYIKDYIAHYFWYEKTEGCSMSKLYFRFIKGATKQNNEIINQ